MKNIPIIGKFGAILAVFGVFSIAVALYATSQMRTLNTGYLAMRAGPTDALLQLIRSNVDIQFIREYGNQQMTTSDAVTAQHDLAAVKQDSARFAEFMGLAAKDVPAEAGAIQAVEAQVLQYVSGVCTNPAMLAASAASTSGGTAPPTGLLYRTQCIPQLITLTNDIQPIINNVRSDELTDVAALKSTTNTSITLTLCLIIVGIAAVMIGAFFAIRAWVITPVNALQATMSKLSGGDLQAKVIGIDRKDEIGGMARAVQVFKEAGLEKQRLEGEAETQRTLIEQERQATDRERAATLEQFAFIVESVGTGLEKLSSGDLLFRLNGPFAAEYEKLRNDFNTAMLKLQDTMKAIAANAEGVRSGAEEITHASDDLSRRTEQQAASLEETAAALDQITATVRRTAENATDARNTVSAAKTDAERSGAVVRDTVQAMNEIETSSKQIGNIIGVIDEIAFQTNLLALNAGVEAARAGDAGRGFAVVATEVRALAQRSADAAKEIKLLISASGAQVATGVKLVGETGQALERIVAQVAQLNGLVTDIAASAQEQATGLNEVNTAVNQMDQVTQQNAAMVEESTAASHGLAGEAQELARLVGQFRIGQEAVKLAEKPSSRKALPPVATPSSERASGRKLLASPRRAAAQQQALTHEADNWDEF
ncbi:MAG TPA: methyl-accepting chemotaxis protein [Acidocella sp.]|nr:methyl-accepting chemotaxis protein [Acidocella sp.]